MRGGKDLKGGGIGKSRVLDQVLVQQRCTTTPVSNDEQRRVLQLGFFNFSTVEQLLKPPRNRIGDRKPNDHERHPNPHETDSKAVLGEQAKIMPSPHAMPEPGRVPGIAVRFCRQFRIPNSRAGGD